MLVARREDKLNELKDELIKEYGVEVEIIAKDLTQPNAAKDIYAEIQDMGVTINYLINNAGFGGLGKFWEREWENDLSMIQLNVLVLTELCRLYLPEMVKRNEGRILNVSSTASLPPGGPLQAVYFATKHFVTSFSYGIAGELHDSAVTVTALLPGATETEFASTSGMEKTKLFKAASSAKSVAEDGYEGMLKGKLKVVSGLTFSQKMQMKMLPFVPIKTSLKMVRKLQEE